MSADITSLLKSVSPKSNSENTLLYENEYGYGNQRKNYNPSPFKKLWQRLNILLAPLGTPVTSILIIINVIMFLVLSFTGGSTNIYNLLRWGGGCNYLIYSYGQIWRLFTSMFLHIGILHLVLNSYSLRNLGNLIERLFGSGKFIIIYLSSGIWGSIINVIFTPESSTIVSAGASGAIFGLAGAFLYLGVKYPQFFKRVAGTRFILVILLNLYIGYSMPSIGNLAHIGGLVGGFLTSWALGSPKDIPDFTCKALRVFIPVMFLLCISSMIL